MARKYKSNKKIFLLLLFVIFGLLWQYAFSLLEPLDTSGQAPDVLFQVSPKSYTVEIAQKLEQQKIIRSAKAFRLYARYHGLDNQIKAGYYLLNPAMSVEEILNHLVRGKTATKTFTIPEGYTLKQITNTLANKGFIREELFTDLLIDGEFNYSFLQGLPRGERRLEGYLFPETYSIALDSTEKDIINVMLAGMDRQIKELKLEEKAKAQNLTLHQAITIASMIEREARKDEDRALISSVIHNRLKIGMLLQIDATVEYALGGHREKIYYRDLEIDSPYNTYKYKGLPPGPIAAPGRESLLAAVTPAQTKYLYYVAKPDGYHAFAETYEEHLRNKAKYLN
ncbi:aminodeoxychorismate lyase [Desulforamulus ferrireducens]|uniref:Endolytic murein transglycosylase n=1 Tax=Desulforamulus ferrireducens TaxID=1833852 RepID=A0A1S6IUE2_9FIRM|nr:aminodeoxychorismate lyase [Desulforamulus ferrireducens]